VYFLTVVCWERRPLFRNFEIACDASRALSETRLWRDSDLLAWVVMPDHWHALVALGTSEHLSKLVQRVKTVTSARIGARTRAPVWQPGFHDRALRSDDDLEIAARYLVANPIRAGLASNLGDYPFWDSRWGMATLAAI
jgi:REP element-mobilizing transposase RayT